MIDASSEASIKSVPYAPDSRFNRLTLEPITLPIRISITSLKRGYQDALVPEEDIRYYIGDGVCLTHKPSNIDIEKEDYSIHLQVFSACVELTSGKVN